MWATVLHCILTLSVHRNAKDVKGKIVGMMRGPRPPATTASFDLKLYYAQEAGAVAVVFFDYDPEQQLYSFLPQVNEGPIDFGVRPIPDGIQLKARIPVVFMANKCLEGVFETEMTWLVFADPLPPGERFFGWQGGFIVFPDNRGNGGLTKSKADTLMAQFLEDRKKERLQETQLLANKKASGDADGDLKSKEFYGGNFFESMNPFKQVRETGDLDTKMSQRVVHTFAQKTGLDALMKGLQRDFEKAIPLEVAWEKDALAGIKLPVIKAKEIDPEGFRVWSFTGKPECAISVRISDGTILFFMWFCASKNQLLMNARQNGKFLLQEEYNYHYSWNERHLTWAVAMDDRGFHISVDGKWIFCFQHQIEWNPEVADKLIVEKEATKNHVEICELPVRQGIVEPRKENDVHAAIDVDWGQWKLVFRQTGPFAFSEENGFSQAQRLNAHDEQAANYSILGELEEHKCEDGNFTFMLRYPETPHLANIWRQSSNPVIMQEEGVDDFVDIKSSWTDGGWGGLQRSDRRKKEDCFSFIDGCAEHGENWSYAIGASKLINGRLPGPFGNLVAQVELYVSTTFECARKEQDSYLCARGFEWHQGTKKAHPICEHGRKKPECSMCKEELAGRFIVDHSPYMPCVPGHGPRWLFDNRSRGLGRLTLDSTQFFDDLSKAPARSCKRTLWPIPYTPDFHQDSCNGFFVLRSREEMMFAGFVREGLPDVFGSLKWPDGTEYHGEFDDGEMSGYGRYVFGDGGEFRGAFRGGLPRKGFYHPPEWEVRRVADYEQRMPSTPLWEMSSQDLLHPEMVDMPMPQFTWSKADCMAISNCITVPDRKNPTAPATVVSDFKHISKPVTARLVWARPIHADQPLWNADEVRGKIVACMRGPRPPAKACSYNVKLYHIQNAGAVGVIFVDYDPNGGFNVIPRAANGTLLSFARIISGERMLVICACRRNEIRKFPLGGSE